MLNGTRRLQNLCYCCLGFWGFVGGGLVGLGVIVLLCSQAGLKFHYVAQASFKLYNLPGPLLSDGITGMCHHAHLRL